MGRIATMIVRLRLLNTTVPLDLHVYWSYCHVFCFCADHGHGCGSVWASFCQCFLGSVLLALRHCGFAFRLDSLSVGCWYLKCLYIHTCLWSVHVIVMPKLCVCAYVYIYISIMCAYVPCTYIYLSTHTCIHAYMSASYPSLRLSLPLSRSLSLSMCNPMYIYIYAHLYISITICYG